MNHTRIIRTAIAAIVLMVGVASIQVSAVDAYQVTVSCSDGTDSTEFTVTVDGDTLNAIKEAVEAMILYPAGLTCELSVEVPLTGLFVGAALADSGSKDFAVGGGQIFVPPADNPCGGPYNFALSAHVDTGTTTTGVGGTYNQQWPDAPDTCPGGAQFKATITCLDVDGTDADIKSVIHHGTGIYSPGSVLAIGVEDIDDTAHGHDVQQGNYPSADSETCEGFEAGGHNDVVRGSLVVKDRSP